MKVTYDPDLDILQFAFKQVLIEETTQIAPGLVLDYDEDGRVIGLELRQASKKIENPYEITYQVGIANDSKPLARVSD
ncbi:MAG: DUF2283 domain-containing protein [Cyanobacteria bacterium J06614_10]